MQKVHKNVATITSSNLEFCAVESQQSLNSFFFKLMRPTLTEKFLVPKEKGKENVKAKREVYTNNIFHNDIQFSI